MTTLAKKHKSCFINTWNEQSKLSLDTMNNTESYQPPDRVTPTDMGASTAHGYVNNNVTNLSQEDIVSKCVIENTVNTEKPTYRNGSVLTKVKPIISAKDIHCPEAECNVDLPLSSSSSSSPKKKSHKEKLSHEMSVPSKNTMRDSISELSDDDEGRLVIDLDERGSAKNETLDVAKRSNIQYTAPPISSCQSVDQLKTSLTSSSDKSRSLKRMATYDSDDGYSGR